MQQLTVNQMNGASGGSFRQKMDLSDACQATDAFAMLFMQLMVQAVQPDQLVLQGEQAGIREFSVSEAGMLNWSAVNADSQTSLADLPLAADGQSAGGAFLHALTAEDLLTDPGFLSREKWADAAELSAGNVEDMKQLYMVLKAAWGGETENSGSQEGLDSSLRAENAFRTARQLLEQQEKQMVVPADVESLQADVNAGRFLSVQPTAQQLPLPSAEEIGQQLKTGILQQTAQGKSEFIVRLRPEGIGEIVVKISDDHEHMSLSIFTASTQAARLISSEVATLQEALRPLQVQVQQVTVLPTEQAVSYASQNALAGQGQQQSFAQQYFEQRQQHHRNHWKPEEDGFDAAISQAQMPDGELDAYI